MSCTPYQYARSGADLLDNIKRTEALIKLLFEQGGKIMANSGVLEYEFDDSQVQVKTKYRSASDLTKDIMSLEKLLQNYMNQLNGRRTIVRNINTIYRR